jgi:membrane protease YdiL (CAAX protease family)
MTAPVRLVVAAFHLQQADAPRWRVGYFAAGFLLSTLLANLFMGFATKFGGDEATIFMSGLLGLWAGFLGCVTLASRKWGSGSVVRDFRVVVEARDVVPGLAIGVLCQLIGVPLLYTVLGLFLDVSDYGEVADRLIEDFGQGWWFLAMVVGLVVIAPIVEEIFYRGLLLRTLPARWSARKASVVCALVFAVLHFQVLQSFGLFLFGLACALLVFRTNRLGPAIFAHIGFNAMSLVLALSSS